MVRTLVLLTSLEKKKNHYTDIKIPIVVAQPLKYYTFIFQMLIYFDSSRKSSFYKAVLDESGPISCSKKEKWIICRKYSQFAFRKKSGHESVRRM